MLLFIFIREEYLTEEANFNTSHVTVYQKDWTAKVADSTISIHLMLLFIEEDHNKITGAKRISIHLMLLFISIHLFIFRRTIRISIHLMLLFILKSKTLFRSQSHFNTSHVTVYLRGNDRKRSESKFQYISCYCLSDNNAPYFYVKSVFQYISCYCLSELDSFFGKLVA